MADIRLFEVQNCWECPCCTTHNKRLWCEWDAHCRPVDTAMGIDSRCTLPKKMAPRPGGGAQSPAMPGGNEEVSDG